MARKGYSKEARKNAAIARKIKHQLGESAWHLFQKNGIIPPGLHDDPPEARNYGTTESRAYHQRRMDNEAKGLIEYPVGGGKHYGMPVRAFHDEEAFKSALLLHGAPGSPTTWEDERDAVHAFEGLSDQQILKNFTTEELQDVAEFHYETQAQEMAQRLLRQSTTPSPRVKKLKEQTKKEWDKKTIKYEPQSPEDSHTKQLIDRLKDVDADPDDIDNAADELSYMDPLPVLAYPDKELVTRNLAENGHGRLAEDLDLATWQLDDPNYKGPDFSKNNQWTYKDDSGDTVFAVGAPYRKEVTPDDHFGQFQEASFKLIPQGDQLILESYDTHWIDHGAPIEINGVSIQDLVGQDVSKFSAKELADVFHEIGLMY